MIRYSCRTAGSTNSRIFSQERYESPRSPPPASSVPSRPKTSRFSTSNVQSSDVFNKTTFFPARSPFTSISASPKAQTDITKKVVTRISGVMEPAPVITAASALACSRFPLSERIWIRFRPDRTAKSRCTASLKFSRSLAFPNRRYSIS